MYQFDLLANHLPVSIMTATRRVPPATFFLISAGFHYFGPSLAVLMFAQLDVAGVAWLRIASAAAVFAIWRRSWRMLRDLSGRDRATLAALGCVLAAMNILFYLSIDRLPLSTVGAIEFLGTITLAAIGVRTLRNGAALILVVAGVVFLTTIRIVAEPLGFAFAFGNAALFGLYLVLGHRIANVEGSGDGIDRLGVSMMVATVAAAPFGLAGAWPILTDPMLLLWGVAVGVCSSVVPYVTDQLAMARLSRSTFALMLSLLPVAATVLGLVMLRQVPTVQDLTGIGLVVAGLAVHQQSRDSR